MSEIKVSVIIPIYNVEQYIETCICSVLEQQLNNIEVICVDDGSTDCSMDIVKKYASEDARIIILQKENGGQSTARNAGIDISQGEYVYFLDSDDYLVRDALQILYDEAKQYDLDNVYFDAESFFESDDLKENYSNYISYYSRNNDYSEVVSGLELLRRMDRNKEFRVSPCLQFFKRRFLVENNLKFEEGIIHEDDLFALQVCLYEKRTKHIGRKLYMRRIRNNSTMTSSDSYQHSYSYFYCIERMLEVLAQSEIDKDYRAVIVNQLYYLQLRALRRILSSPDIELDYFLGKMPLPEEALYRLVVEKNAMNYREIAALKKDNKRLAERIEDLEKSKSFRIGRLITFIPGKIKKLLCNIKT